ncbi:MAG: isoprenylcysteine carboxylmethyltransferase family protein [Actinobacteria bacterium]|nr:isoprenylcysteine carboxylmethyltransferase family protein [Actinomycetota bacterium]MBU1609659.1 isoprenylcysteine carboxylmethyltransferase family protein [Actinomycetota bacterium]MBU2314858.1 isoprenylcysteine carboxylmethyltransferase family protein [Actinomycetota bacterium]MBU2385202.1 isoprenylcysteine carboxylmethyltransferase family protein [Actinomycetota bacterium]
MTPAARSTAAWTLVAIQFALLAVLVVVPPGSLWVRDGVTFLVGGALVVVGLVIAVIAGVGLGRALTPSPVPRAEAELVTTGAFALTRHPIYSGLLVLGAGLAVIGASPWHLGAWAALLVTLMVKSRFEERLLLERYEAYAQYAARVGRLVPGVGRIR